MEGNNLYASAVVTGKRQITIPKEVCDYLDIKVGNKVVFREKDGSIIFELDTELNTMKFEVDKKFQFNFIIPFVTVSDMLTLGQISLFNEVFIKGEEAIKSGGKVIIRKEYTNAKPQVMRVVETLDDLISIKNSLLDTVKK